VGESESGHDVWRDPVAGLTRQNDVRPPGCLVEFVGVDGRTHQLENPAARLDDNLIHAEADAVPPTVARKSADATRLPARGQPVSCSSSLRVRHTRTQS
jgi:hypothetical protein